ncbi:hypothetical protein SAMN04489798_0363 [Pseudomonas arsenicoxydans]|uniref:Uncharacterized protein n=1 Tax=Pseudomonas arsenicoxydans TaxID=702115 RepID=A0A1H0BLS4_9PSED|nr:hypothetical protein SAMN04489798_0363 [Pseudomonas arsenicoxydans]
MYRYREQAHSYRGVVILGLFMCVYLNAKRPDVSHDFFRLFVGRGLSSLGLSLHISDRV